jgi:hypothetical protein
LTFLYRVSGQIGFDVKGRIRAVTPEEMADGFVKNNVIIKVDSKEQCMAVLQLSPNAESKTDEFCCSVGGGD